MVLSNKAMLKKHNLLDFSPVSESKIIADTNSLVDMAMHMDDIVNDYFSENFYTEKNSEEIGGFTFFCRIIFVLYSFYVIDNDEIYDKTKKFFDKQFLVDGSKLYSDYKKHITLDMAGIPVKDAYCNILLTLIPENCSRGKTEALVFGGEVFFENSRKTADYFKDHGRRFFDLFDLYKKDIIDKCDSNMERLGAVLAFIYTQLGVTEYKFVEKKAVKYLFSLTGYKAAFLDSTNDNEIRATRREAKTWMKNHKKPKTFMDIQASGKNPEYVDFIYRLLDTLEIRYLGFCTNKELMGIGQEELQELLALFDKYDFIKDNQELKDLLIYMSYALFPVAQQLNRYTVNCLDSMFLREIEERKHNTETYELKNEIEPLKKLSEQRQESLNKLQLKHDKSVRGYEREIERLKAELAKCQEQAESAVKENKILQELNEDLEKRLDELDIVEEQESEEKSIVPNSYVQQRLKEKNILIMGGHQIWQNKIKEIYPYFNFIDTDNINFDINITRNADIVLFNTLHCSHTLYYKMKNNTSNGRGNTDKVIYIGSNNLMYFKDLVTGIVLGKDAKELK